MNETKETHSGADTPGIERLIDLNAWSDFFEYKIRIHQRLEAATKPAEAVLSSIYHNSAGVQAASSSDIGVRA